MEQTTSSCCTLRVFFLVFCLLLFLLFLLGSPTPHTVASLFIAPLLFPCCFRLLVCFASLKSEREVCVKFSYRVEANDISLPLSCLFHSPCHLFCRVLTSQSAHLLAVYPLDCTCLIMTALASIKRATQLERHAAVFESPDSLMGLEPILSTHFPQQVSVSSSVADITCACALACCRKLCSCGSLRNVSSSIVAKSASGGKRTRHQIAKKETEEKQSRKKTEGRECNKIKSL